MKVAIITDQHFGARNDSLIFLDYYEKFYAETFFPVIDSNNINTVLILGDTFDRRKYVNFYSLQRAKKMFFDPLAERNIQVYMLVGNHDTYFKNTNDVNSPQLLLEDYPNIHIISSRPETIHLDYANGHADILMVPWISLDNYNSCLEEIKNSRAEVCMGHFEIDGFVMHPGATCEGGLSRSLFSHFDTVFSGHYHYKSTMGNITYLGNPYQLTWIDYGLTRGFHLFDPSDRSTEFIPNPNTMFHKIVYDDTVTTIEELSIKDFSDYKNTYVKVVVVNKTNPYIFDKFLSNLYLVGPADVTIVEDFTVLTEGLEDDTIDQAEDTMTIINNFVDSQSGTQIDNNRLKSLLRELYVEAQSLDQT
jgi:DNA repair exonuclease SbcCD nuclease subunit